MLKACHRLNDVSFPNFYDEALTPNVAGLEGGPFKEISKTERGGKSRLLTWKD